MPPARQPLQNVLWLVGERVVRGGVTATVLGVVARYLQPAGFGRLNLAVAIAAVAASLANVGLEGLVVSELIRRPDRPGAVLGTALRLRLAGGAVAAIAVAGLAFALGLDDAPLIAIVATGLLLQPVEVVDLWFQRHLDSRRTVVARFLGVCAGATIKLWLVVRGSSLPAFAWAQVADVALIALALVWSGRTSPHPTGPWSWDPAIARALWHRGAPLALAATLVAFALRLDQFLVRTWLGEDASGIYFAASRLSDMALFAGAAATLSLFPALADAHAASPDRFRAKLQSAFDALSALGWGVALFATFAGGWAVRFLYGRMYVESAGIFAIQGWACLFALNAGIRWNFILLAAPPLLNIAAAIIHMAVMFTLGVILLPRMGTAGAAFALLGANFASGYLCGWLFRPLRECARLQTRGLLIVFTPARWPEMLRQFHA
ncbi:MAG TPA: oligosaccharide flippase family protein [Candidatus Didemnitutus sp.]